MSTGYMDQMCEAIINMSKREVKKEVTIPWDNANLMQRYGYVLAMRILQSELFKTLDQEERAALDFFIKRENRNAY